MQHLRLRRYIFRACSAAAVVLILGTGILVGCGLVDRLGTADIGLVLGSKVGSDGTPSPRLRARLDRTVELYRLGYFPAVITSGGIGKEGYDEASVMRDYLVSNGIPGDRVIVDSRGTTTYMSAKNTVDIARQRKLNSVFVVSQYFHIPRSRLALKRFGVSVVYSAHARFFEARDIYSCVRELFGYLNYFFRLPHPSKVIHSRCDFWFSPRQQARSPLVAKCFRMQVSRGRLSGGAAHMLGQRPIHYSPDDRLSVEM